MNEDELRNAHDRFVKFAFSNIENSRNLFAKVLPADVLATLDLTTLAFVPGSFVDAELRERLTDMLFQVSLLNGEEGFVYILFDHKSSPDSLMPFKMLRYMVRIWDQQLRNQMHLSPIVPLILYHGVKAWATSRTMQDIVKAPEKLKGYVPKFNSALIDLSQYSDDELRGNAIYTAVLQVLKYVNRDELADRLPGILELFVQIMDEPDGMECLKAVLMYLSNATERLSRNELTEALHHAFIAAKTNKTESDSPMPTIAEQLKQEGREEGLEKGLEKGLEQGLQAGISVVLELRFPAQAETLADQISELHSVELLQDFLNQCRTARNADELQAFLDQRRDN